MSGPSEPPFLDEAGIVQFQHADHFAHELDVNIFHGRVLVRTHRTLRMNEALRLKIRGPVFGREVSIGVRVVFVQNDLAGLQITDLTPDRKEELRHLLDPEPPPGNGPEDPPEAEAEPQATETLSGAPPGEDEQSTETIPIGAVDLDSPGFTGTVDVRGIRDVPGTSTAEREPDPPATPEGSEDVGPHPSWPRLASQGVEFHDPSVALAVCIMALRCGRFAISCDADLESHAPVHARFSCRGHACELDLRVASVVDGLAVMEVDDPTPLAELIGALAAPVLPVLEGLGLVSAAAGDRQTSAETGEVQHEPQAPTLLDGVVRFATTMDLERELEANVKSGGLFVESSPLPLRERLALRFQVGASALPVDLAADVVFADGGRVGFSFAEATEAYRRLKAALASASSPATPDVTGGLGARANVTTEDIRAGSTTSDDLIPPFSGEIVGLVEDEQLPYLQSRLVSHPGELMRTPTLLLFEFIVRSGWTGVLQLSDDEGAKSTVYFYRGDLAFVEADPFEEHTSLGRILISQKKVNETSLREALERSRGSHRLLGKMLVMLGALKQSDLSSALREQTRAKLDAAFRFRRGSFSWQPWREPPGEADLVVTKGISVLERYIRNRFDALGYDEIEGILGGDLSRVVVPGNLDELASSLRLQAKELRFLELQFDGTTALQNAVLGSSLGRLGTMRLVGLALALGLLRFGEGTVSAAARTERQPQGRELRTQLEDRLEQLQAANHFEVLALHWSSPHRELKPAWEKARSEFALDRPPYKTASSEIRTLAKRALAVIDEAYQKLRETSSRVAYRKELFDKTERQYAAEMLIKRGEIAQLRGNRREALDALETAAELNPTSKVLDMVRNLRSS